MKGLTRFEEFAARLIEGAFKQLPGRRLEPVEIARRLARAMEDEQTIVAGKVWVPNEYQVHLHPDTLASFADFENALEIELAMYLEEEAEQHGFSFVGRPHVHLIPDAELRPGSLRISAAMAGGPPSAEDLQSTQKLHLEDLPLATQQPQLRYKLLLDERAIPLTSVPVSLGRSLENDIILEDPSVSRRHAQIIHRYGRLLLRDLNSRYGTFVNGRRIEECVLRPGDVIGLGEVTLRLEQMEEP